jgi:hypothetical protein
MERITCYCKDCLFNIRAVSQCGKDATEKWAMVKIDSDGTCSEKSIPKVKFSERNSS